MSAFVHNEQEYEELKNRYNDTVEKNNVLKGKITELTVIKQELLESLKDYVSLSPSADKLNFRQLSAFRKAQVAIRKATGGGKNV